LTYLRPLNDFTTTTCFSYHRKILLLFLFSGLITSVLENIEHALRLTLTLIQLNINIDYIMWLWVIGF